MPVKVRVLVEQGIKAVRAGGDDLALWHALEGGVERFHVLGGQHLEEELVARASRRVAGAGFVFGKHRELHACGMQQFHDSAGGLAGFIIEGAGATNPEEVLEFFYALANDGHFEAIAACLFNPSGALAGVAAPGVAFGFKVFKQARQLRGELGFGQYLEAAHGGNVVEVFNIHGALLHAGTAIGAAPQHVLADHIADDGAK
ncbi:hypothetical protein GCM10007338_17800 [Corynebacterium pelargi]|nr:hypothetical protein GCM10007338_17800 [Corynebacterium pelargi]